MATTEASKFSSTTENTIVFSGLQDLGGLEQHLRGCCREFCNLRLRALGSSPPKSTTPAFAAVEGHPAPTVLRWINQEPHGCCRQYFKKASEYRSKTDAPPAVAEAGGPTAKASATHHQHHHQNQHQNQHQHRQQHHQHHHHHQNRHNDGASHSPALHLAGGKHVDPQGVAPLQATANPHFNPHPHHALAPRRGGRGRGQGASLEAAAATVPAAVGSRGGYVRAGAPGRGGGRGRGFGGPYRGQPDGRGNRGGRGYSHDGGRGNRGGFVRGRGRGAGFLVVSKRELLLRKLPLQLETTVGPQQGRLLGRIGYSTPAEDETPLDEDGLQVDPQSSWGFVRASPVVPQHISYRLFASDVDSMRECLVHVVQSGQFPTISDLAGRIPSPWKRSLVLVGLRVLVPTSLDPKSSFPPSWWRQPTAGLHCGLGTITEVLSSDDDSVAVRCKVSLLTIATGKPVDPVQQVELDSSALVAFPDMLTWWHVSCSTITDATKEGVELSVKKRVAESACVKDSFEPAKHLICFDIFAHPSAVYDLLIGTELQRLVLNQDNILNLSGISHFESNALKRNRQVIPELMDVVFVPPRRGAPGAPLQTGGMAKLVFMSGTAAANALKEGAQVLLQRCITAPIRQKAVKADNASSDDDSDSDSNSSAASSVQSFTSATSTASSPGKAAARPKELTKCNSQFKVHPPSGISAFYSKLQQALKSPLSDFTALKQLLRDRLFRDEGKRGVCFDYKHHQLWDFPPCRNGDDCPFRHELRLCSKKHPTPKETLACPDVHAEELEDFALVHEELLNGDPNFKVSLKKNPSWALTTGSTEVGRKLAANVGELELLLRARYADYQKRLRIAQDVFDVRNAVDEDDDEAEEEENEVATLTEKCCQAKMDLEHLREMRNALLGDLACNCLPWADARQFNRNFKRLATGLPITRHETEIKQFFQNTAVGLTIVEAATGSGKSTQVPQYALESLRGKIVVTQPRHLACRTLSTRISQELGSAENALVTAERPNRGTSRVEFSTDASLLRRVVNKNCSFQGQSAVILDEVHERSISTDFLIPLLRVELQRRGLETGIKKGFHVVLMSATMNVAELVQYFSTTKDGSAPSFGLSVLNVTGRTFPVEISYCPSPGLLNYTDILTRKVLELHRTLPCSSKDPNHILAFLPKIRDVETVVDNLKQVVGENLVFPLHAQVEDDQERAALQPSVTRKIIISTTIAETSLTIDGVVAVVDSGLANQPVYDAAKKMTTIRVVPITQASAKQRAGRAGRTRPGHCYRLYTEEDMKRWSPNGLPEILQVDPLEAVLKAKTIIKNGDVLNFGFLTPPSPAAMGNAVRLLQLFDALGAPDLPLTKRGELISKLPLPPRVAQFLLCALAKSTTPDDIVIALATAVALVHGSNMVITDKQTRLDARQTLEAPVKAHALGDMGALVMWVLQILGRQSSQAVKGARFGKYISKAKEMFQQAREVIQVLKENSALLKEVVPQVAGMKWSDDSFLSTPFPAPMVGTAIGLLKDTATPTVVIVEALLRTFFDQIVYGISSPKGVKVFFPMEDMVGGIDKASLVQGVPKRSYVYIEVQDTSAGPYLDFVIPLPDGYSDLLPERYRSQEYRTFQMATARLPSAVQRFPVPAGLVAILRGLLPAWLPRLSFFGKVELGQCELNVAVHESELPIFKSTLANILQMAAQVQERRTYERQYCKQESLRFLLGPGYRVIQPLNEGESSGVELRWSDPAKSNGEGRCSIRWQEPLEFPDAVLPVFPQTELTQLDFLTWLPGLVGQKLVSDADKNLAPLLASGKSAPDDAKYLYALHMYSLEESPLYGFINSALRNEVTVDIDKYLPIISLLMKATRQPPEKLRCSPDSTLKRGTILPTSVTRSYRPGQHFSWFSFTSASESEQVAQNFASPKPEDDMTDRCSVVFDIHPVVQDGLNVAVGVKLESLSKFPQEREVLLPPATFEIVSFNQEGFFLRVHLRIVSVGAAPSSKATTSASRPPTNLESSLELLTTNAAAYFSKLFLDRGCTDLSVRTEGSTLVAGGYFASVADAAKFANVGAFFYACEPATVYSKAIKRRKLPVRAKLFFSWTAATFKGTCFLTFAHGSPAEIRHICERLGQTPLNGQLVTCQPSHKDPLQVMVTRMNLVSEDEVNDWVWEATDKSPKLIRLHFDGERKADASLLDAEVAEEFTLIASSLSQFGPLDTEFLPPVHVFGKGVAFFSDSATAQQAYRQLHKTTVQDSSDQIHTIFCHLAVGISVQAPIPVREWDSMKPVWIHFERELKQQFTSEVKVTVQLKDKVYLSVQGSNDHDTQLASRMVMAFFRGRRLRYNNNLERIRLRNSPNLQKMIRETGEELKRNRSGFLHVQRDGISIIGTTAASDRALQNLRQQLESDDAICADYDVRVPGFIPREQIRTTLELEKSPVKLELVPKTREHLQRKIGIIRLTGKATIIAQAEKRIRELVKEGRDKRRTPPPQATTATADIPEVEPLNCAICDVELTGTDEEAGLRLETCGHGLCSECLNHQLTSCITNNQFPLTCPCCLKNLFMDDVDRMAAVADVPTERVVDAAVRGFLQANCDRFIPCQSVNCPGFLPSKTQDAVCPVCLNELCTICREPHPKMNCQEYAKKKQDEEAAQKTKVEEGRKQQLAEQEKLHRKMAVEMAQKLGAKQCPKCREYVLKSEGCNAMTCKCGAFFCYLCGQQEHSDDPHKHFGRPGEPCYMKLFTGVYADDD